VGLGDFFVMNWAAALFILLRSLIVTLSQFPARTLFLIVQIFSFVPLVDLR